MDAYGDSDPHANANRHAHRNNWPNEHADTNRDGNAHMDNSADRNTDLDTGRWNGYTDADAHANAYANQDTDSHTNWHADANQDTNRHCNGGSYANANRDALSSDSQFMAQGSRCTRVGME